MKNESEPTGDHNSESSDDRSSMAKAIDKASEVFTACLMLVLPGVGGHFVDKYLNTYVTFTILGFLFGLVAGTVQMIKIVKQTEANNNQ